MNYFEHFLNFISAVSGGCVSVFAFASLVGIRVAIASSLVGLKICNHYRIYVNHRKMKKYQKVLISKALINSYINHNEFFSVNNVLKEDNKMKQEIKNSDNAVEYAI